MVRILLGGWIRNRRVALGHSLREVAGRAGITASFLCDVERGLRFLRTEHFRRMARALRCSVRDLSLADEMTPCGRCGRVGPRGV